MRTFLKSHGHRVSFKPSTSSPELSRTWEPCPASNSATLSLTHTSDDRCTADLHVYRHLPHRRQLRISVSLVKTALCGTYPVSLPMQQDIT